MKYLYLLFIIPVLVGAEDLKSLLHYAKDHNNLIKSAHFEHNAKMQEKSSLDSSYYPTLDASLFYKRDDDATPFQPAIIYGATLHIGVDIYDGGKKTFVLQQKENELQALEFSLKEREKNTALFIMQTFYNIKSLEAAFVAQEESLKAVKAQLKRVEEFYSANLATSDDIDRLQSAYDKNLYSIESLKFKIFSLKKSLELSVGKEISFLGNSIFQKNLLQNSMQLDGIASLNFTKKSLQNMAQTFNTYYYPQIKIEDSFSVYGYRDTPATLQPLDNQNTFLATLNIRLFDFHTLSQKQKAVQLQAEALQKKIEYKTKEQKMQLSIALERIKSAKLNIKSSHSSLKAAKSALVTITQKYQAGMVDNIIYLDALSMKTQAQALYEKSLNDLEIAYGIYYYYNAKDLEEYL